MKLGKLQRKWVNSLKAHPERQHKHKLGGISDTENIPYEACCLGQAGLIMRTCVFKNGSYDLREKKSNNSYILENSYKQMGLWSSTGNIQTTKKSLTDLNDDKYHTWVDIAYLIEAAPELFFTKSI